MADEEAPDKNALPEWQEARATITRFDNNLHDLRKYGFGVIAALLAANSIQVYFSFDNFVKISLTIITITFIIALLLFDVYYQRIMDAASIRARVLESVSINFELDTQICDRFKKDNLKLYIKYIYISLIILTVLIGVVVIIAGAPDAKTETKVNSSTTDTLANSSNPSNTSENSTITTLSNSSDPSISNRNIVTTLKTVTNTSTQSTTIINTTNVTSVASMIKSLKSYIE